MKTVMIRVNKLELKGDNMMRVEATTLDMNQTLKFALMKKKTETFAVNIGAEYLVTVAPETWTDKEGRSHEGYKAWYSSLEPLTEQVKKGYMAQVEQVAQQIATQPVLQQKAEAAKTEKVDWDGKELRSHRRACLAIASGLIQAWYARTEHTEGEDSLGLLAEKVADSFLTYVYKNGEKAEVTGVVDEGMPEVDVEDDLSNVPF